VQAGCQRQRQRWMRQHPPRTMHICSSPRRGGSIYSRQVDLVPRRHAGMTKAQPVLSEIFDGANETQPQTSGAIDCRTKHASIISCRRNRVCINRYILDERPSELLGCAIHSIRSIRWHKGCESRHGPYSCHVVGTAWNLSERRGLGCHPNTDDSLCGRLVGLGIQDQIL